jgi:hypothetical protein
VTVRVIGAESGIPPLWPTTRHGSKLPLREASKITGGLDRSRSGGGETDFLSNDHHIASAWLG